MLDATICVLQVYRINKSQCINFIFEIIDRI